MVQPGDVREAASSAAREVIVELQLGSSNSRDRCRWNNIGGELQMEQQQWRAEGGAAAVVSCRSADEVAVVSCRSADGA